MNKIMGGYLLLARQIFQSKIWTDKPSTWVRIWIYILGNVNHSDNGKFKRGEGFFNFKRELKDIGCDVTYDMVKKCLRFVKDSSMISTSRSTRGIIIKVLNFDKYQDPVNYKSTSRSTSKAPEKHLKSTSIHKNDKNVKNDKNISKDIKQSFGNEDINLIINHLREKLGTSLDGTIAENRRYAKLLLDRFGKDYPDLKPSEQVKHLINFGLRDTFHAKNITNIKYLYYNAQKIIQAIKKNNMTII
jgi:hypothetical protein